MTLKSPAKPSHAKGSGRSASKTELKRKVTLPSGRVVTVGYAVEVARDAGIITKTGKVARFYAPK